jgi:hypothetical protein
VRIGKAKRDSPVTVFSSCGACVVNHTKPTMKSRIHFALVGRESQGIAVNPDHLALSPADCLFFDGNEDVRSFHQGSG